MKLFKKIWNYICYCGIEKDEYKSLKKDAYISNFEIWRILHILMTLVFAFLFIASLSIDLIKSNMWFYLGATVYSLVSSVLFLFVFKKDSLIAQIMIYLSISLLFLFAAFITNNKPDTPSTTFIALLIITPMFMIDKPYFVALELALASTIFIIWMYYVKEPEVWKLDLGNLIIFAFVGMFISVIANSIRVKEFVLAREIKIQKDTDDLTGLKNKGATTREINEYLVSKDNEGIMFLLDINYFKSVNDTYGHDVGDSVIKQLGKILLDLFNNGEIAGRFGGDEFIIFIKGTNDQEYAKEIACKIADTAKQNITLPDKDKTISVSMGIAMYHGQEKNYSEIFKKADIALYKTKADRSLKYAFYEE